MLNIPAGWKPISSAPKDGTEILAWRSDCGQFIASYTSADSFPMTQDELDAWDEETLFAKDWFTQWPQAYRLEGIEVPTHWMPLPDAPGSVSPSAPGDAQDEPIGTLSRNADETIRFTPARDFHVKDGMPVFSTPAAGDALDEKPYCYALETRGRHADMNDVLLDVEYNRTDNFSGGRTGGIPLYRRSASAAAEALQFLADTEGAIESLTLGGKTRYRVWWPAVGEIQGDWFESPEAAIAAAAQVPQQGEA